MLAELSILSLMGISKNETEKVTYLIRIKELNAPSKSYKAEIEKRI